MTAEELTAELKALPGWRPWGIPEEIERRRRILVAVWAYAYEFMNDQLVGNDI